MEASQRRCGPRTEELHDFYEPLILLRVLEPSALARLSRSSSLDSKSCTWQPTIDKFLDRLSWMCDYELGGTSVCAIGMESTASGTKFWFAAAHRINERVHKSLHKILERLSLAHALTTREAEKLERDICNECIANAAKKVKTYARLLCDLATQADEAAHASDPQLCQDIGRLVHLAEFRVELCSAADHFRDSESLRRLSRKVKATNPPSLWSSLRHYIGRLGSWHRASRTLVEFARAQPRILRGFEIEAVSCPKTIHAPRADDRTNLHSALRRMFPQEPEHELMRGIDILDRLRGIDIAKEFYNKYTDKTFRPRVHAEVCLLEHFYQGSLNFVEDYRYIGCSKPSCYCCDLYFKNHPSETLRRPSHGNVWVNWQPPLQCKTESHQHTTSILTAMTQTIRQDVKNQILSPAVQQRRLPDSTTGMTTTSPTVDSTKS